MERWREHVSVGKERHNAIEGPLLVLHETVENPKQAVEGSEYVNTKNKEAYKLRCALISVYRNCLKVVSTIGPFEKCNLSPQRFQLKTDVFKKRNNVPLHL